MKRFLSALFMLILPIGLAIPASAAAISAADQLQLDTMKQALFIILMILAVLVIGCIVFSWTQRGSKGKFGGKNADPGKKLICIFLYVATAIVLLIFVFCIICYRGAWEEATTETLPP